MQHLDRLFEPFDERTLASIRRAYRQAWPHVRLANHDTYVARNRLIGTLATLAGGGIKDPDHLKCEALKTLAA
jgi:hypothetical protein